MFRVLFVLGACLGAGPVWAADPSVKAGAIPAKPGSPERESNVPIQGHIVKPALLGPPELSNLKVPDGFRIEVFARDLGNTRILAVSPEGNVYVTRREQADVLMFKPGANGLAEGPPVRVAARPNLHGLCFHDGKAYLVAVREIYRAEVLPDGQFGELDMIVQDLADGGQHHNRTLAFGPDGMMYVSVGSTCNECNETNPENGTMLKLSPDGKTQRTIFATGLRNTVGFGWHPKTGEMWGMDHGIDWLGDDDQPEELNRIEEGKHYGWPYHYGDNKPNPNTDPPAGVEKSEWAKVSVPMVLGYTAHSAPMQMAFYTGSQFPADFQGHAFVAMRGSWNRKPPSGYEIVRVRFTEGKPTAIEPFVTGFLTEEGQQGRPCGVAVARDGSLLFTDDRHGIIYRVSHTGGDTPRDTVPPPAAEPVKTVREPVAMEAPEARTEGKLDVESPAYENGAEIPLRFSGYDQNASVPLTWSAGPDRTKSYVILMDDPDADLPELPVPHWVVWNIPADQTRLHAAVPKNDRLLDPKGMMQGTNYAGKVGYDGPRPAAGDPPHNYHIQIFALDTELDLPLGAKRAEVLSAMKGHVLAAGAVVGQFQRPPEPKKP